MKEHMGKLTTSFIHSLMKSEGYDALGDEKRREKHMHVYTKLAQGLSKAMALRDPELMQQYIKDVMAGKVDTSTLGGFREQGMDPQMLEMFLKKR